MEEIGLSKRKVKWGSALGKQVTRRSPRRFEISGFSVNYQKWGIPLVS